MARNFPSNLAGHARRILEAWPWPLVALSLLGLAIRRGPLIAPLLHVFVLALVAVPPYARFAQLFTPALAAYAAEGGAWVVARWRRPRAAAAWTVTLLAVAGMAWCWRGPAGTAARTFDDGPMPALRAAGAWLREHGKPGAIVMDRKAYIPFYARTRYAAMPGDDYDTIVEWARRSGADYFVVEEYVVRRFRPQLGPLIADPAFVEREHRLKLVYARRGAPGTGVAIFAVVR